MRVFKFKTMLTLGWLLIFGLSAGAQVSLELESQTTYFIFPDRKLLLTRQEYLDQYRQGLQATNSVTVTVQHFNEKAAVSNLRKKTTPSTLPKDKGPVVQISLVFARPLFDASFVSFAEMDRAGIQKILTKFEEWETGSDSSQKGTQLRRPFPESMAWPVTNVANNVVTLTELPLLFMRGSDGKTNLMFDKDKDFPNGLEETAQAVGGQAGGEGGAAAKSKIVDHWMSAEEMALFEEVLKKVNDILKKNREAIQKLN
ncbi:MAG: hypothetical protein CMM45_03305 [Rhodospirillaceae bacterium]|nr:hypothetical protein [Rhodospirillaceae bacterium]